MAAIAPSKTQKAAPPKLEYISNVNGLSFDAFNSLQERLIDYATRMIDSGEPCLFRMSPQTCCDYVNRLYKLKATPSNYSDRRDLANSLLYQQCDEQTGWSTVPQDPVTAIQDRFTDKIYPDQLPAVALIDRAYQHQRPTFKENTRRSASPRPAIRVTIAATPPLHPKPIVATAKR